MGVGEGEGQENLNMPHSFAPDSLILNSYWYIYGKQKQLTP